MLLENESPTYLLSKGDKAGAEHSAKSLWGEGYKIELYGSASEESGAQISHNAAFSHRDARMGSRVYQRCLFPDTVYTIDTSTGDGA